MKLFKPITFMSIILVLGMSNHTLAKDKFYDASDDDDYYDQKDGDEKRYGNIRHRLPYPSDDGDYYDNGSPSDEKVQLGKVLFYDKILSGNKNTSCATCHHALTDTGDGLSLPIGEGGVGLGVTRDTGTGDDAVEERVPRNAPSLFSLGAREFTRMFHDGRVEVDSEQPSGFLSPAGDGLPSGLDNVLAAQAMFPVTSAAEMAGQDGENSIADAAAIDNLSGAGGVWEQLAERLASIPEYVELFMAAYPEINHATEITYVDAANAIAAFEATAWRADNSPFDRYLRGERNAMSKNAQKGMKLFYGRKANCVSCHSGTFQTDHEFYSVAMPQIGPGKGDGDQGNEDFGRIRVTGEPDDLLRFRTPSLRNVALTGPWGHSGAYNTLEAIVRHMLEPTDSLQNYDSNQVVLPSRPDLDALDLVVHNDDLLRAKIAAENELEPVRLNDRQVKHLIDFMHALTDPGSIDLRDDVPSRVPSGLPLAE